VAMRCRAAPGRPSRAGAVETLDDGGHVQGGGDGPLGVAVLAHQGHEARPRYAVRGPGGAPSTFGQVGHQLVDRCASRRPGLQVLAEEHDSCKLRTASVATRSALGERAGVGGGGAAAHPGENVLAVRLLVQGLSSSSTSRTRCVWRQARSAPGRRGSGGDELRHAPAASMVAGDLQLGIGAEELLAACGRSGPAPGGSTRSDSSNCSGRGAPTCRRASCTRACLDVGGTLEKRLGAFPNASSAPGRSPWAGRARGGSGGE